eukprot:353394-Chlamydomonas_euryale.AAC.8
MLLPQRAVQRATLQQRGAGAEREHAAACRPDGECCGGPPQGRADILPVAAAGRMTGQAGG